jgi:cyclopropane fatty-acyl-phospholipid synthase-like methyltransferase
MPLHFSNPHTQADLCQLSSLIAPLMAEHFATLKKEMRLLNIACGRADETGILADILAPHCQQLEITGIDIRNREIGEAKQRWCKMLNAQAQFFTQDASQLSQIHLLDGPFEVLFIRHQNYWDGAEVWHRIYDNALHCLNDEGVLVITSYFDREHLQAVQAISAMGGTLTTSIRNPKSRIISDAPHQSVDRHIAVFTKSAPPLV